MSRRKYIPFRGDDYSKSTSANYIQKSRPSLFSRVLTLILLSFFALFVIYSTGNSLGWSKGLVAFWISFSAITWLLFYFAKKDAEKINSKNENESSQKNKDD